MTGPGAGGGGAAGPEVSVAWHSTAVREAAGQAAGKLAAEYVAPALAAKDPGLWGPGAAADAAVRLGWLDAPRASRALLGTLADAASGLAGFGDWAEQLIAESTGKQGRGILPVVVGSENAPGFSPGPDVHLAALGATGTPVDTLVTGPLGAQFLIWEYAVAIAGRLLGINPFDQPNVTESKQNTARILAEAGPRPLPTGAPTFTHGAVDGYAGPGPLPAAGGLAEVLDTLLIGLPDRGYLAIMAYLDRDGDRAAAGLRDALAARTTYPVTFGWGPRCLHSTGQYHKGGPQNGVFLQITGAIEHDIQVPGRDFTLGKLQLAQALGDLGALHQRGRPAVRLHLRDRAAGLSQLLDAARASTNGALR